MKTNSYLQKVQEVTKSTSFHSSESTRTSELRSSRGFTLSNTAPDQRWKSKDSSGYLRALDEKASKTLENHLAKLGSED